MTIHTRLAGMLVLASSAALLGPATGASADPADYSVVGIDVSNHQGYINWGWVTAAGTKFAYAKATEGFGYVDRSYDRNRSGARANGVYFGAYAYGRPDLGDPQGQADFLVDQANYSQDGRTLPPMLDIEWPWWVGADDCYGLSPRAMRFWIRSFVERIRARTGRPAVIYTHVNWWNPCTGSNSEFGDNPLFVARYARYPGSLPASWSSWTFWQYADSGDLPGDQDVFNGTLTQLDRFVGAGTTPAPDTTPPPDAIS
jgi:GH25 family lysozyme M1 (1,4-beta-N-acetylmuramidase)